MTNRIDLNSDLGEAYGPWPMGDDPAMLSIVTSANIACGGHASDPETMFKTLQHAKANNVAVGAHPGYNDREGFGRRVIPMHPSEIGRMITAQIGALISLAVLADTKVSYMKLHGALANLAARDKTVAEEVAATIEKLDAGLAVLAISGTELEHAARAKNLEVYSEIFADRGYLKSGQLIPRGHEGAMIHDADVAADRLVQFLKSGLMPVVDGDPIKLDAHSICVHGDSETAVEMARVVQKRLRAEGTKIVPFINA